MSQKARVERMYESLSAVQRAGITIRQVKAGEAGDGLVASTMPDTQAEEYNSLIGQFLGLNLALMGKVHGCWLKAKATADRLCWLEGLWLWGAEAHALRCLMQDLAVAGVKVAPELEGLIQDSLAVAPDVAVRGLLGSNSSLEEAKAAEDLSTGDRLMLNLLEAIVADLKDTQAEAKTLSFVSAGLQVRLGGEDPLWPKLRRSLGACLEELEAIRQSLERYVGQVEPGLLDSGLCTELYDLVAALEWVFGGQRPAEDDS